MALYADDLEVDLRKIEASLELAQDAGFSNSMESDQWEMVESPEEAGPRHESLSEFREDLLSDQEEAIELCPTYPQVLLKLLQLVARTDGYRDRLHDAPDKCPQLDDALHHLERSCETIRGYIEGTGLEELEPTVTISNDEPLFGDPGRNELTCSWGEVDVASGAGMGIEEQELKLQEVIDNYVNAMGDFWVRFRVVSCEPRPACRMPWRLRSGELGPNHEITM